MKLISVLLLIALHACDGASKTMTADDMEARIAKRGAKAIVAELNQERGPTTWSYVEDHIASGDAVWLKVAQQLKPFTDAGSSEGLDNAVGDALPKAPVSVLHLIGSLFPANHVCSGGQFIEAPKQTVVEFLKTARTAVSGVRDPALVERKADCLHEMEISLKNLSAQK